MVKSINTFENDCTQYNIALYISKCIAIIIFIVIIISLNNLEHSNCKCADLPYRDYLKEWFIIAIVYTIIILIIFSISNYACWQQFRRQPYIFAFTFIYTIIHIIMLIRLFLYIRALRNNCDCGYGNKERFIYWYLILLFAIVSIIIILGFVLLLFTIIKFSYN
jgi:hypothetical protein